MARLAKRLGTIVVLFLTLELLQKFLMVSVLQDFQDRSQAIDELSLLPPQSPTQSHGNSFHPLRVPHLTTTTDRSYCQDPPSLGVEGKLGFQGLLKIQIPNDENNKISPVQLLCVVILHGQENEQQQVSDALMETYAPYCDGFLAVGSVRSSHILHLTASATTSEWQVFQQTLQHLMTQGYLDDFSVIHVSNSPNYAYVIPENLKALVLHDFPQFFLGKSSTKPMILGGAVVASRRHPEVRHCGGGAGITLNRAAVSLLANNGICDNKMLLPWDQAVAHCLKDNLTHDDNQLMSQNYCAKTTTDAYALRYLEFGVDYQATWSKKTKPTPIKTKPLADHHGIYMPRGLLGIARDVVAIHLVHGQAPLSKSPSMGNSSNSSVPAYALRRFHAILRRDCDSLWDVPVDALDESGAPGYVHDPGFIQTNPLAFTFQPDGDAQAVCEPAFGSGVEGDMGYKGLQKILVASPTTQNRVLCLVYTHEGRHHCVRAIAETFGRHCDGFLAASNVTDRTIGAVHLLHEGPEEYANMWLKVRAMWKYVHKNYLNDFDYFHIGGDDHYLIAENLKEVAATGPWNTSKPLFLGGPMVDFPLTQHRYCGGGSGYTLNRAALQLLVEQLFEKFECRPHHRASDEDRLLADCFRSANVLCMDTNDELEESRYHQASANYHASWTHAKTSVWHADDLFKVHKIVSKEGLGQISKSSVSFHLKGRYKGAQDNGIRRYHAILYGLCPIHAGHR